MGKEIVIESATFAFGYRKNWNGDVNIIASVDGNVNGVDVDSNNGQLQSKSKKLLMYVVIIIIIIRYSQS